MTIFIQLKGYLKGQKQAKSHHIQRPKEFIYTEAKLSFAPLAIQNTKAAKSKKKFKHFELHLSVRLDLKQERAKTTHLKLAWKQKLSRGNKAGNTLAEILQSEISVPTPQTNNSTHARKLFSRVKRKNMQPLCRYNFGRNLLSRKKNKKTQPKKNLRLLKSPPHPQNTYTARETNPYLATEPM